MAPQEQSILTSADSEMLLNMVISAPELEPAKKELNKHLDEVKKMAESNLKLHDQVR